MLDRPVELTIAIEIFVFGVMSVIGSALMIFSFCFCSTKKQRKSRFPRMVLYLGIGDFILTVGILYSQINYLIWPDGNYDPNSPAKVAFCKSQAFFVLFGQLSKLFWLLSFSLTIFLQVTLAMCSRRLSLLYQKYFIVLEVFFHVLNWIGPLIVTTCLLVTGHLGKAFIGCWLLGTDSLQFFVYYGPLVGIFFVTLALYLVVIVLVCVQQQRTKSMRSKSITKFLKKNRLAMQLSTYSLVFLLLWAPAMAGSLYNYITRSPQLWMLFPQFIWTWGGFIDGIVYSMKRSPKLSIVLTVCCFGSKGDGDDKLITKDKQIKELEEELLKSIGDSNNLDSHDRSEQADDSDILAPESAVLESDEEESEEM